MTARAAEGPVAGLFGKLPAHGDFVRRGWEDATVDAIDRWLTDAMDALRAEDAAVFETRLRAAPLWRGYVPAGALGPAALHLGLAPSIDRAGRLFPLVAGVAGKAGAIWAHALRAGEALDAILYDAVAGRMDADAATAAIAGTVEGEAAASPPDRAQWWHEGAGAPLLAADYVDGALLRRLLVEEAA